MAGMFQCGFIRCCIFDGNKDLHSSDTGGKYQMFENQFKHIKLEKKHFSRRAKEFAILPKKTLAGERKRRLFGTLCFKNLG